MTPRRQFPRPAALTAGLLAVALLSACGGEPSAPGGTADDTAGGTVDQTPTPTTGPEGTGAVDAEARTLGPGEVLTPDDAGAVLRLTPGDEASLHLTPPWQDAVAEVSDPAVVELVPVDHFADPGYAEYTVLAHAAGRAVVDVQQPDGESLELTVVVEE